MLEMSIMAHLLTRIRYHQTDTISDGESKLLQPTANQSAGEKEFQRVDIWSVVVIWMYFLFMIVVLPSVLVLSAFGSSPGVNLQPPISLFLCYSTTHGCFVMRSRETPLMWNSSTSLSPTASTRATGSSRYSRIVDMPVQQRSWQVNLKCG